MAVRRLATVCAILIPTALAVPAQSQTTNERAFAGEIVPLSVEEAGHLRVIARHYIGGSDGNPHTGAEISARRRSSDVEDAKTELRFQLAAMALDAGWRYIEVHEVFVATDTQVNTGNRISNALAGLISKGRRTDKTLSNSVRFVDEPNEKTVDAVDSYNRLGAQLFGPSFVGRSAPAALKLAPPNRRRDGW